MVMHRGTGVQDRKGLVPRKGRRNVSGPGSCILWDDLTRPGRKGRYEKNRKKGRQV
jgi:hypothetical protein